MCTVSWNRSVDSLVVRFNRDEQRSRAPGSPPAPHSAGGVAFLAPSDPAGGGTWFALNSFGVVLALLNHHADYQPVRVRSRGLLIPSMAGARDLDEVRSHLFGNELVSFRPFLIVALVLNSPPAAFCWNGYQLEAVDISSGMLSSSSFEPERILPLRQKAWREFSHRADGPEQFHSWQNPGDGAASVLMSRSDARTVSRCRALVTKGFAELLYEDLEDSGRVSGTNLSRLEVISA